jgi:hypothetical protein
MSSQHIPHKIFRDALGVAEKLEPLKSKKDPVIAAIAGFAGGGVGLGLYLQSWVDFFVPFIMMLVVWIIAIPTGEILSFFIPVFWAVYGFKRAKASNAKLERLEYGILDVEVITEPLPSRAIQTRPGKSQTALAARLSKLDDLMDAGMLSPTEYESRREKILAEI